MKLLGYLVLPLTVFCLLALMAGDADAKRMGGGRSFGSKPSFSKNYNKPTSAATSQKQAGGTNKQQGGLARPGMGLLGGLLAGTFLGSMLGGFGGMGGGFFNILIIGLLAYLGFKFFKSRQRGANDMHRQGNYQRGPDNSQAQHNNTNNDPYARRDQNAQNAWDHLSSKPSSPQAADSSAQQGGPSVNIPAGFDEEDFLEGAKAVYTRLQKSWDKRDMADIELFASAGVLNEIKQQAQEDPGPSQTDVLMVNARLLEVKEEGGVTHVTVYYDVLLREDPAQSQPSQAREVWHFVKPVDSDGMWKLDGIQQLEE